MRDTTIARNYAEALLALASRADASEEWGKLISDVSDAIRGNQVLRLFLESPRVSSAQKKEVLAKALEDRAPRHFVLFLQWLVKNRRQMLVPEIAIEYHSLLDDVKGRVHASVTVARETDDAGKTWIAERLSQVLGKQVIPHVAVNPGILGGIVVRIGDTVMDGSVRRRLSTLRARLT
jgi:F-type H+-transporting ATPase subunit delta